MSSESAPAGVLELNSISATGSRRAKAIAIAVARRLAQLVVLLFSISTLLFVVLHLAGDPALVIAGEGATPDQIDRVREHYGLNQPLYLQYVTFISQAIILDFGPSFRQGFDALDIVTGALPATLQLTVVAMLINVVLALVIGAYLGTRPASPDAKATLGVVLFLQGVPSFVIGLLLIQVFSVGLGLLPSYGHGSFAHLIMPAIALSAFLVPNTIRVVASAVQEAWDQPFVRTADSFGLSRSRIMFAHVLPNALLGVMGLFGVQFGALMGGALVTEVIFSWPGLGLRMVDAARMLDFPVLQAGTFLIAVAVFVGTVVIDLLVPVLDPRVGKN